MAEDNYWLRRARSRHLTRRTFVGGAAVTGVGAAALGLVGCGDDDDEDTPAPATTAAGSTTAASGTTAPAATTAPAQTAVKGGVLRATSANNTWDVFDIDRSIFSTTTAFIHDITNEGVVHYSSFKDAKLEGAFAEKWEQPSPTEIRFTVRTGLKWHNKPPVNGRAAKADDIKQFILRNRDAKLRDGTVDKSTFYRSAQYQLVDTVDTPDDKTVVVKFKAPNIFFLDTLAASYAKVQAPEAIDKFEKEYNKLQAEQIMGTGPYEITEFKAEGTIKHKKFEGHPRASETLLDRIEFLPLFDQAAGQAAFEQKQMDAFTPAKKAVLDDLEARFKGQLYKLISFTANPGIFYYQAQGKPWNDPRLVKALYLVIDRRKFVQQLYQGLGGIWGGVSPSQTAFQLKESELIQLPGFLEDRAKDIAEAKKLWEAAQGNSIGEIVLDIPDVLELALPGFGALWKQQVEQLGGQVKLNQVPFSTVISKINTFKYGNSDKDGSANLYIGVTSDTPGPDPTLEAYQFFNSTQPRWIQQGVKVPEVDALTEKAFNEPDIEKRKVLMRDFSKLRIANAGMGIAETYASLTNTLRWNYLKTPEQPTFVASHNIARRVWIDPKDPSFAGRPA
jgi:peptide/nickel transport system substrate-binding protein